LTLSAARLKQIRLARKRFFDLQSDLFNSRLNNFGNHLNALLHFSETDPIMVEITTDLKSNQNVVLEKWWEDIFKTRGSFVGSKRYALPVDINDQASLFYKFILGINEGKYDIMNFCLNVYGHRRLDENIYEFNNDIMRKLTRIINQKLLDLEEKERKAITKPEEKKAVDPTRVFVVHGRNIEARKALFAFLRSLSLIPMEWSQAVAATGKASPYIGEVLDTAFSIAQATVVLLTPDDEARLREPFLSATDPPYEKELIGQPRQNVLFEAGMSIGYKQDRTILVELGNLRHFSDILGRHTIRIDNSPEKRNALALRLKQLAVKLIELARIGSKRAILMEP